MIESIILDRRFEVLQKGLNTAAYRHNVISNNIANADTPGYKISEVGFETELARALDKGQMRGFMTDKKHIPLGAPSLSRVSPTIMKQNDTRYRNDENNVDIEKEMAKMAQNQLKYNALAQRTSGYFRTLQRTITG